MKTKKILAFIIGGMTVFSSAITSVSAIDQKYFDNLNSVRMQSCDYVNWSQFGPGNAGFSERVNMHPTTDAIFNSPDMGNHYCSQDGGETFFSINDVDEAKEHNANPSAIFGLDFSRQDPDFGIAAAAGLWVTTNQGVSFQKLCEDSVQGRMGDVAVDPKDDNVWYAGSGRFWDMKGNYTTHVSPHGIGPLGGGLYYISKDKGQSWTKYNTEDIGIAKGAEFGRILVHPDKTNIIFAMTSYGLYKSTDSGLSYKKLDINGDGKVKVDDDKDLVRDFRLYFDEKTKKVTLFAIHQMRYMIDEKNMTVNTVSGGIVKSTDLGETWTDITGNLGLDLSTIPQRDFVNAKFYGNRFMGRYFAGYKIPDSNNKMTPVEKLSDEERKRYSLPTKFIQNFDRLVVDPTDPNRIYISHNHTHGTSVPIGDIWKTENGGKTWTIAIRIGKGWKDEAEYWKSTGLFDKDTDFTTSNAIYYGAGSKYYDEIYSGQAVRDLDIDSKGNLYLMTRFLLKSTDHGKTWINLDVDPHPTDPDKMTGTGGSNLPGSLIITVPDDDKLLYLGTGENGLYKVTDKDYKGRTYIEQMSAEPATPAGVAILPSDNNVIYLTVSRQEGQGGFYKSVNGGKSWEMLADVYCGKTQNCNNKIPGTLIIDPDNEKTMYFSCCSTIFVHDSSGGADIGTEFRGVWKTTDGGYTWAQMNKGFPSLTYPHQLTFDPDDSKIIYAGVPTNTSDGQELTVKGENVPIEELKNWIHKEPTQKIQYLKTGGGIDMFTSLGGKNALETTVTGLKPNTQYSFNALASPRTPTFVGTLRVIDENGKEIKTTTEGAIKSGKFFSIIFTTGPKQTSVTLGLYKEDGTQNNLQYNKVSLLKTQGKYEDTGKFTDPNSKTEETKKSLKTKEIQQGGLYVSKNGAESWTRINTLPKEVTQVTDIEFDPLGNLYVTGGSRESADPKAGGLWVSKDKGKSWKKLFESPRTTAFAVDVKHPNRLMLSIRPIPTEVGNPVNTGVYLSEDYGDTWKKINVGIGNSTKIYDVAFDKEDSSTLWATSQSGGFLKGKITKLDNQYPVFSGVDNKKIALSSTFDKSSGVSVKDKEDGKLSFKVSGDVNTNKAGTYKVYYSAKDINGGMTYQTRYITVGNLNPVKINKTSTSLSSANLITEIKKANSKDTIIINGQEDTKLSKDVLKAMKDKNVNLKINYNWYSWTINASTLDNSNIVDLNLKVNKLDNNIDSEFLHFSIEENKNFPSKAKLDIQLPGYIKNKTEANLFKISGTKTIYQSTSITKDYSASFDIYSASEYLLSTQKEIDTLALEESAEEPSAE